MKRSLPLLLLLLCFLAGLIAWWCLRGADRSEPRSKTTTIKPPAESPARPDEAPAKPTNAVTAAPAPSPTNAAPTPPSDDKTGPRYKRAYMLSLDKGALALVEAQDIEGDFAPRRGKEEEWSTMLRFRLMSETNAVLAEELLPAPDQVCQVLDPRAADGKAVNYTTTGPVIFQVRLPRVKAASRLDVFRIIQPGDPVVENRIASLPLSH